MNQLEKKLVKREWYVKNGTYCCFGGFYTYNMGFEFLNVYAKDEHVLRLRASDEFLIKIMELCFGEVA